MKHLKTLFSFVKSNRSTFLHFINEKDIGFQSLLLQHYKVYCTRCALLLSNVALKKKQTHTHIEVIMILPSEAKY